MLSNMFKVYSVLCKFIADSNVLSIPNFLEITSTTMSESLS